MSTGLRRTGRGTAALIGKLVCLTRGRACRHGWWAKQHGALGPDASTCSCDHAVCCLPRGTRKLLRPSIQHPGSGLRLCLSSPLTGALGSYCFRSSFPIIHSIWFPWRKLARSERELSPVLVPSLPSHLFFGVGDRVTAMCPASLNQAR